MSTLTKPRGDVTFGTVTIGGQRLPVQIAVEWDRYLTVLTARAGGTTGLGTADVDAGYFAAMQPINMGASVDLPELWQPCRAEPVFGEIFQTGGDCCLPDMTFQE